MTFCKYLNLNSADWFEIY